MSSAVSISAPKRVDREREPVTTREDLNFAQRREELAPRLSVQCGADVVPVGAGRGGQHEHVGAHRREPHSLGLDLGKLGRAARGNVECRGDESSDEPQAETLQLGARGSASAERKPGGPPR